MNTSTTTMNTSQSYNQSQSHVQGHGQQNGGSGSHRRRSLSSSRPTKTSSTSSSVTSVVGTATTAATAASPSIAPTTTPTTTTAVEDQLRAMLSSEDVYTPSLCLEAMSMAGCSRTGTSSISSTCSNRGSSDDGSGDIISHHHAEWRSKICEWSYRVIDHFRYDREVVSVAMNYFDRYLALVSSSGSGMGRSIMGGVNSGVGSAATTAVVKIDSRTYQLAAMAALYVATKLHADQVDPLPPAPSPSTQPQAQAQPAQSSTTNAARPSSLNHHDHRRSSVNQSLVQQGAHIPPTPDAPTKVHRSKLRLSSFVELSRGQFSARDIVEMERQLLDVLRWRVNPPTPMVFVSHLLRVMPLFGRPSNNGNNNGTTMANDPTSLQHRTLVLHVLHELSRYLTELSICLPPSISSHHTSSELAYVAILLSLDLLSDVTAVPRRIRADYLRRLDWLSGGRLNASRTKMVALKEHIGRAFVPDMLQDSLAAMGGGEVRPGSSGGSACAGHPIVIARDAGLLSEEVERRCGGRCFTPTPNSSLNPQTVAPSVAAAEMEVEVEFNPPPSEPAIGGGGVGSGGRINTSFDSDQLVVSANASLAGASVDSFEVDIDDDDITDSEDHIAAEYTMVDPETGRNRSVNCVAEQAVMQLHSTRNTVNNNAKSKTKRSDKYVQQHQHPFHATTNATTAAVLAEPLLENTTSTGTAPPGHVRKSSCSSWMSDSSESPISVIAEALNAAAAMGGGGGCGSAPHQASSSGGASGQARPPTHQVHHQAPAQGYLL